MKIAAVTMAYNEPDYVPIWTAYYGRQLGARNCTIIDHGSDDGSTRIGGCNVLRIPRSPKDNAARTAFLSEFCTSLLEWYDVVLHTDIDEIVVPDPRHHDSFAAFCAAMRSDVVTAVGLDVLHMPEEPDFDPAQPVLAQRAWAVPSVAMCKPVLTRRPISWAPGFHSADAPVAFDAVYLFHLRYFDRTRGLRRLAQTRAMPWAQPDAGAHQRVPDATFLAWIDAMAGLPRNTADWDLGQPPVAEFTDAVLRSQVGRERETYRIALDIPARVVWRVPERFSGVF